MADEQDEQICRICFQGVKPGDIFLAPCKCSGSQRWVHQSCLEQWQWSVIDGPNSLRAVRCSICEAPFKCGLLDGPMKVCKTIAKKQRWKPYLPPNLLGLLTVGFMMVAVVVGLLTMQPDAEMSGLRAGTLLVATGQIRAGIFVQSVILMVEHSRWGALGFIVNKPFSLHKHPLPSIVDGTGGPVQQNGHLAYLYTNTTRSPENIPSRLKHVVDGVWWHRLENKKQLAEVEAAVGGVTPKKRLYGYAGWAPRQLEMEIARGAWKLLNATQDVVFDPDPATLWKRLASFLN